MINLYAEFSYSRCSLRSAVWITIPEDAIDEFDPDNDCDLYTKSVVEKATYDLSDPAIIVEGFCGINFTDGAEVNRLCRFVTATEAADGSSHFIVTEYPVNIHWLVNGDINLNIFPVIWPMLTTKTIHTMFYNYAVRVDDIPGYVNAM